jgi:hypothetical protein
LLRQHHITFNGRVRRTVNKTTEWDIKWLWALPKSTYSPKALSVGPEPKNLPNLVVSEAAYWQWLAGFRPILDGVDDALLLRNLVSWAAPVLFRPVLQLFNWLIEQRALSGVLVSARHGDYAGEYQWPISWHNVLV